MSSFGSYKLLLAAELSPHAPRPRSSSSQASLQPAYLLPAAVRLPHPGSRAPLMSISGIRSLGDPASPQLGWEVAYLLPCDEREAPSQLVPCLGVCPLVAGVLPSPVLGLQPCSCCWLPSYTSRLPCRYLHHPHSWPPFWSWATTLASVVQHRAGGLRAGCVSLPGGLAVTQGLIQ